jgi:hypothetical protein
MESENNKELYKYSENGIKNRNYDLWLKISNMELNITFKEKFYLYENNKQLPICYCGNNLKFIDMANGFREFCSRNCMYNSNSMKEKRKETNIKKYGVDNPSKSNDIKEKVKESNMKKFGVEHAMQNKDIKNKMKETTLERYGVDNPSKIKEVRDKAKKTMKERYGVEYAMHSEDIKENLRNYFMEKYGVDNPSKIKEVRDKAKKTMKERYGVEYALQNHFLVEKMKRTNLERYGFEYPTMNDNVKEKIKNSVLKNDISEVYSKYLNTTFNRYGDIYSRTELFRNNLKLLNFNKNRINVDNEYYTLIDSSRFEYNILHRTCNSEFIIQRQLYRKRIERNEDVCLKCNPISKNFSICEKEILSFIKSIYSGEILENHRINNKEIDIYLPELKIGFEYNGLYWHSELHKNKDYHFEKYNFFNSIGLDINYIWEDEWELKKDIVKSIIKNKLGLSDIIYARKCEIKEVDNNDLIRNFLDSNHIQGFVGSKIKLGLFYNNELVSLMTFGSFRKVLGSLSKDNSFELLRFCNSLNTSVVGGASKLFKFFLNNYTVDKIISYSMNSYSNGNLYENLNFIESNTNINYYWCKNGIRYHRFNFRKDKLISDGFDPNKTEVEIMYDRSYFRTFDYGVKTWIYINF